MKFYVELHAADKLYIEKRGSFVKTAPSNLLQPAFSFGSSSFFKFSYFACYCLNISGEFFVAGLKN